MIRGRIARWVNGFSADHPGLAGLAEEPLPHVHGAVLALAAASGVIHVIEGIELVVNAPGPGVIYWLGVSLVAAGIAYFIGVGMAVHGFLRGLIYRFAIPFTAGQFPVWYWFNRPITLSDTLGIVDKSIQLVILVGLVAIVVRDRTSANQR